MCDFSDWLDPLCAGSQLCMVMDANRASEFNSEERESRGSGSSQVKSDNISNVLQRQLEVAHQRWTSDTHPSRVNCYSGWVEEAKEMRRLGKSAVRQTNATRQAASPSSVADIARQISGYSTAVRFKKCVGKECYTTSAPIPRPSGIRNFHVPISPSPWPKKVPGFLLDFFKSSEKVPENLGNFKCSGKNSGKSQKFRNSEPVPGNESERILFFHREDVYNYESYIFSGVAWMIDYRYLAIWSYGKESIAKVFVANTLIIDLFS